ncbi:MAG TPA: hypothetical protein VH373_15440 [Jatrophihabitantaceae bacterium]|jgi:hypothetical protein
MNELNTHLNAAVVTEHQHQLRSEAASYRRSRKNSKRRSHRVTAFLKDLSAASL